MIDQKELNIQKGNEEIWRREKLLIAAVASFLPYGLFVMMPLSELTNDFSSLPLFLAYVFFVFKVALYYRKCPCPQCGWVPGDLKFSGKQEHKCPVCGFRPTIPKPVNYTISFKEIKYTPIGNKSKNETGQQVNQGDGE